MNDLYTAHTEKLRADLVKLCKVEAGVVHTQAICAMMVTVPAHMIGTRGSVDATAFAPTDPKIAGGLLACGLTAFRALYPEAFAFAMTQIGELPAARASLPSTVSIRG